MKHYSKRLKNYFIYTGVRVLIIVHSLVPRTIGLMFFGIIGTIAFCFPHKEKRRTIENLTFIFGNDWSQKKIMTIARNVYRDLGKNAFDALYFYKHRETRLRQLVHCEDLSAFRQTYDNGRGIMAITAHCGCFEMLLHYFAQQGFSCFAIGSRLYDKKLDTLVTRLRSGHNIFYVHRNENPRTLLKLLKEAKVMGALIDQDTRVDGVFAHFLGKLAYTPSGAVKMAMRYDIPLFVVTTVRRDNGMHCIFISRELPLHTTGNEQEDLVRTIETINNEIGTTIRRFPSQWVWMHQRWKRKPESMAYQDCPSIERYS